MEITAWRNQEAALVNPYSKESIHFKKIRNIFHQGLVHPWPYRIVRIALAALFIYGGVPVYAAEADVFFRENFVSLSQWETLTFPKIKVHSTTHRSRRAANPS